MPGGRQVEGFKEVIHTADWGLRVWAPDMARLLVQAAAGMYYLLEAGQAGGALHEETVELKGESREALLVTFLSELLYFLEDQHLVFEEYHLAVDDCTVKGQMRGRKVTGAVKEIKAVTYHNLSISVTSGGYCTTIIFDV